MVAIPLYNLAGELCEQALVDDAIFSQTPLTALMWEQVKALRASKRAGTHSTKTRANVRGGGAKPYKQKGTGRARQGSKRAPHYVGGGVVFGPHPRDYAYRLPKTARRKALISALSLRTQKQRTAVLGAYQLEAPSTKTLWHFCQVIHRQLCPMLPATANTENTPVETVVSKPRKVKVLLVGEHEPLLALSMRNLPTVKYLEINGLNVYDILRFDALVLSQKALTTLLRRLNPNAAELQASSETDMKLETPAAEPSHGEA